MLDYIFLFYKCRIHQECQVVMSQSFCFLPTYLPYGLKSVALETDGSLYPPGHYIRRWGAVGWVCSVSRKTGTVHVAGPQLQSQTCLDLKLGSASFWSCELQQLGLFSLHNLFSIRMEIIFPLCSYGKLEWYIYIKQRANKGFTVKDLLFKNFYMKKKKKSGFLLSFLLNSICSELRRLPARI